MNKKVIDFLEKIIRESYDWDGTGLLSRTPPSTTEDLETTEEEGVNQGKDLPWSKIGFTKSIEKDEEKLSWDKIHFRNKAEKYFVVEEYLKEIQE